MHDGDRGGRHAWFMWGMGFVAGVLFALTFFGGSAHAHDAAITGCNANLRIEHVAKVKEWVLPNGLLAEAYDRNGDGVHDIVALSVIKGTEVVDGETRVLHDEHPMFYLVDLDMQRDAEGKLAPERVYIDKVGAGKCEDIVLYEDLTIPHHETPHAGNIGL